MSLAQRLNELCREKDALLIINDHADLAAAVDAHGVHVGQEDLPVASARQVLKDHQIVGRSNHHAEEALDSQAQGADYVAVGAMYPTGSKDQPIVGGPALLSAVKNVVDVPVVAIGGINAERAPRGGQKGCRRHLRHQRRGAGPQPAGRRQPPRGSHPTGRRKSLMPSLYADSFAQLSAASLETFTQRHDARERGLRISRQVIRLSANAIRAVHRSEFDRARELIAQARADLEVERPHPSLPTPKSIMPDI